jgi:peptidoglycan/LPS O-acetylase OafA/YrhL
LASALPSPDRGKHFDELDGYRGLTAALIVIHHAYQYTRNGLKLNGFLYEGTPLHVVLQNLDLTLAAFFVLSGFLIFLPFAEALLTGRESPSIRTFLFRRAARILPVYYVAVLAVWGLRYSGLATQRIELFEHLGFLQVFDSQRIFWTIGPAWSLADEVLFYLGIALLGPFLAPLGRPLGRRGRLALLTMAPVALIALAVGYRYVSFAALRVPDYEYSVYFGPVANLDPFALGMLIAVVRAAGGAHIGRWSGWALRIAGVAMLVLFAYLRTDHPLIDVYHLSFGAVAFGAILSSTVLSPVESRWQSFFRLRPLQLLGLISYSLYLWHEPIMLELGKRQILINPKPEAFLTNSVLLLVLSTLAAAVSYRFIERPAMRWARGVKVGSRRALQPAISPAPVEQRRAA